MAGPRRRRSSVERRRIVEETLEAGASVARVALKYGVNANQVFQWRRLHRDGKLDVAADPAMKLLTIYEVACWAHARRKFHEIHITHASPTTSQAIERVAALYAIEAEIRGSTPEIRKTIRQARARPLLDSMRLWLEAALAKLSAKSDTAAAIRYALSRWRALTR